MNKTKFFNENIFSSLFILFPVFLVTGPALTDIYVTLTALFFFIYCLIKKDFFLFNNKLIILLFIFWLFLVFSSILSNHIIFSLKSSLPYVRFIFFLLFIYFFSIKANYFFNEYIFKLMVIFIIFVTLDTYLQFFIGVEIFGHKIDLPNQNRLTGPFAGDERIVGSYLSNFIFLVFGYLLYKSKNNYKKELLAFSVFILIYTCIFLTGERMAFILTSFGSLLLLLFNFKLFKKFSVLLIILITILGFFTIKYDKVRVRMINSTFEVLGFDAYYDDKNNNNLNFLDSHYGAHYLTAIEIFKDNKFFGSGAKTFRISCSNPEYANINSHNAFQRCSTHPHNYYLQILSETGFFWFFFFFSINFIYF